jgi:hypothetical protein
MKLKQLGFKFFFWQSHLVRKWSGRDNDLLSNLFVLIFLVLDDLDLVIRAFFGRTTSDL